VRHLGAPALGHLRHRGRRPEQRRLGQRLAHELRARSREHRAPRALPGAQAPAEPAQPGGVERPEGGEQQRARRLLGERSGIGDHAQREQQRCNGGFAHQRQLITGDLDRDPYAAQDALGQGYRASA